MKKLLALILALAMCLSLVACGGDKKAEEKPAENKPAATQGTADKAEDKKEEEKKLDAKEIVFGYIGPQTGSSAYLGIGAMNGAQMAIDEINAAGGILGVPVRYETRDDESDPTKSLTYVEELIYNEGMNVQIGQANSACAAATAQLTADEKVLVFHPGSTGVALIDAEKFPTSFRVHASNDSQAGGLVNLALEAGYTEAVIIADTSDLGVTGAASLNNYAKANNLKILDTITFVAGDADLTAVANDIKASGSKCVLSFALGADAIKIITALDRVNYLEEVTMIGYSGTITPSMTELAATMDLSGIFGVQTAEMCILPGEEELHDSLQAIYETMNEEYGHYTADGSGRTFSTSCFLRAYESVYIAKWLIEQTGSIEGDVLAEYLEQHSAEVESKIYVQPYTWSDTNHEGFSPKNIISVTATGKANDGVKYFGDLYYGTAVE